MKAAALVSALPFLVHHLPTVSIDRLPTGVRLRLPVSPAAVVSLPLRADAGFPKFRRNLTATSQGSHEPPMRRVATNLNASRSRFVTSASAMRQIIEALASNGANRS